MRIITVSYTHLDVYKRQILNRGACAQRSNCAPDIEAENTGQGEQQDRNEVDRNSFFPGPSEQIDGEA